jgi:putative Mn2+ efflux pump MntP
VAGVLLILVGLYTLGQSRRRQNRGPSFNLIALTITGAALSIDNLVIGFALGTQQASLALTVVIIGTVSVGMSVEGIELGDRLGTGIEHWSQELSGAVLVAVGIITAAGVLLS